MRIITPKDKRGLLIAFRVFLRAMSGERISQQAGDAILEKALSAGISFDALLNKENWGRALELNPELTAKDYVDILAERRIDVRDLKSEPLWHEVENGFPIIAEAAHDFFMEVSGRGGKWNIPSALTNLAKAIKDHSLQAILSETLINELTAADEEMTYFGYILKIVKDFDLNVDDSLTEAQEAFKERKKAEEKEETPVGEETVAAEAATEAPSDEENEEETAPEEESPEDVPFPEMNDEEYAPAHFETTFITQNNPRDMKRDCLKVVLENYSVTEILGLAKTMEGGAALPLSDVIDCLTDGKFNPALEDAETRSVHQNISADLMPSFIESVRYQGVEMDETLAVNYDILRDNWDLRTPEVRKLHKLKRLIVTYGQEDPDLEAAIRDIEDLYLEG